VLGKAFAQLRIRYSRGLEVSAAVLEDFSAEEMSHLAHITQRHTGPVNETAMLDCVRAITDEHQTNRVQTDHDLLEIQKRMQQRKGT
jgi:hypothetical protein